MPFQLILPETTNPAWAFRIAHWIRAKSQGIEKTIDLFKQRTRIFEAVLFVLDNAFIEQVIEKCHFGSIREHSLQIELLSAGDTKEGEPGRAIPLTRWSYPMKRRRSLVLHLLKPSHTARKSVSQRTSLCHSNCAGHSMWHYHRND